MNENRHDKMPSHDIDDLFRSAIEPLEERPSSGVWDSVEKDLDRYNIINIKRKYDNLKKIAIALALVLSSTLLYEFQTQRATYQNQFARKKLIPQLGPGDNLVDKSASEKQSVNVLRKQHTQETPIDLRVAVSTSPPDIAGKTRDESAISTTSSLKISSQQNIWTSKNNNDQSPRLNRLQEKQVGNRGYNSENIAGSNNSHAAESNPIPKYLTSSSILPASAALTMAGNGHGKKPVIVIDISRYDQSPAIKKWAGGDGLSTVTKQSIRLTEKKRSFSLSLIFSPDFTSRVLKEDWPINREDNRDEIRKSERYAFSYSFGALVDYKISKHWGIESGLTLSRAVINIDPKFIFARPDDLGDVKYKFNSSSGYSFLSPHSIARPVFGDSLHAFASSSALLYLSIPVAVKYELTSGRFNFYATAGIAANILAKDKIKTSLFNAGNLENAVNHDIKGLKPVYYSALFSAGGSYNINNTLAVTFAPTARLGLTSINKEAPVRAYQQSLGLVAGLQVSF